MSTGQAGAARMSLTQPEPAGCACAEADAIVKRNVLMSFAFSCRQ